MPEKHFYFSIGAAFGTLISFLIGRVRHKLQQSNILFRYLYKKDHHWFLFFPVLIFMVALWGLVPDIIHAFGILPKEVTRGEIFNIFFLHSYFEQIEDSSPVINRLLNWCGEIVLFGISLGIMYFYTRQIKAAVKNKERHNK